MITDAIGTLSQRKVSLILKSLVECYKENKFR